MTITDITFLFLFLPVALAFYYFGPIAWKSCILLGVSLLFYACGAPEYFLLLIISILIDILLGQMIGNKVKSDGIKKILLVSGVSYHVLILVFYKYLDFIMQNIGMLAGKEYIARNLVLPLGLSFFTFKAISYLVDVYKGKIPGGGTLVRTALYLSFFAQVWSGPLSRYHDMCGKIEDYRFRDFAYGIYRFIIGFNKKILISNVLANITGEIFAAESSSVSYAWLGAICYSLQLFFDFAGYSDMAIGISWMFGFKCPENFNFPYMTSSVAEFWRRWHITLGAWFRDYIYIPMGGSRVKSKSRLYINLFVVWFLTGIWHGASWNFIFWGIAYFVWIAFEKMSGLPQKLNNKVGRVVYRIAVLAFINFQWVIFNSSSLTAGVLYIKNMLVYQSNPLKDARALFLLKDNFVFIFAAVLLCAPVIPMFEKKVASLKKRETKMVCDVGYAVVLFALFLWAVSFVVAGQNNPFAYANF